MDYQSNSKKSREIKKKDDKPETFDKVITGEVVVRKKSLGERLKSTFLGGDAQSVARYIAGEVLLPALRNLLVDATTKGVERMVYGETNPRRRQNYGPRVSYNSPVNRGYRSELRYPYPQANLPDQPSHPIQSGSGMDIVLQSREEAELVLERMNDIIETYDIVSVADFKQIVGLPTNYIDNRWVWYNTRGSDVRQVRDGFLLNLPPSEPI